MTARKYGVLLVTGMQTHQENYAEALAADPRVKLIALTDEPTVDKRRRELNEALAKHFNIPYIENLSDALKRDDVDIISICAEPERRGRIAIQCAQAGKHLYLDKSLAPELEDVDKLIAAVKRAKVRTHMFSFITQAWAAQARDWIQSGELGELRAIHADSFFAKGETGTAQLGKPRDEEFPPKRHQLLDAKRELDNVGVYPITLIHWLAGKPFQRIHAVTGNYFFREHQRRDVEDFGLIHAQLADGIQATLSAGRYGWTTHPSFGVNRLVLVGSKRAVTVDAHRPRIEVYTDEEPWTPPDRHPEDPMGFWSSTQEESGVKPKTTWISARPPGQSDASYFLDCLDADRDSEMSVIEAGHAAEVLIAAYQSAARRKSVTLPLPR